MRRWELSYLDSVESLIGALLDPDLPIFATIEPKRYTLYMIAYIEGVVSEREEKALIVIAGGVGYRVLVGSRVREQAEVGSRIQLKTYHHITDNDQILFGFTTKEDQDYFELLITVPSVGPKTAMGILDIAPPSVLAEAVVEEDMTLLTKISGVGKRTAERIIVELKGKVGKISKRKGVSSSIQQEAIEALVSIGYTPAQARTAAQKLPPSIATVEEAVRAVLQNQGA